MARQNPWKSFGDAFNATYGATTTLGKAIATGGIAFKDYEDEEGNKLTGIALDRARMEDRAAAEERFGDPEAGIRMRQNFETQQQNKLMTDLRERTQDERVLQEGKLTSDDMRSTIGYRNAAAVGLRANARSTNLAADIREASKASEIGANTAGFDRDAAEANLAARLANTPESYSVGLAKLQADEEGYIRDRNQAAAESIAFKDPNYLNSIISGYKAQDAENKVKTIASEVQLAAQSTDEWKGNEVARILAESGRAKNVATINYELSAMPEFKESHEAELKRNALQAKTALINADIDNLVANTEDYQDSRFVAGLSNASADASRAKAAAAVEQRTAAANEFISNWYKDADPENPSSMAGLIEGLKQIDPAMAMKLERDFGEHELWQLTSDALILKQRVNNALNEGGYDEVVKVIDQFNGDKLGVRLDRDAETGSVSLVETDEEGNIVRTIASGKDEKAFAVDLNRAMNPADTLDYLVKLSEINLRNMQALYNQKQAEAGKALTPEQSAYQTLRDANATPYEKQLALGLLFKENPEAYENMVALMQASTTLTNPKATPPSQSSTAQTDASQQSTAESAEPVQLSENDMRSGQTVLNSVESAGSISEAMKSDTGRLLLSSKDLVENAIEVLKIQIANPPPTPMRRGGGLAVEKRRKQLLAELEELLGTLRN